MAPRKRKRNYAAEYRRRQELSRERGYSSFYDYRAHGYGKRSPKQERYTGKELRKLRGHAGAADLAALLRTGKVETLHIFHKEKKPRRFEVISETEDGDERTWYIQGANLDAVIDAVADLGPDAPMVVGSPKALQAWRGND